MCQLLESIKCKDGRLYNLARHQKRMKQSMLKIFGVKTLVDLEKIIRSENVPDKGLYKCRLVYSKQIEKIEFIPYQRKDIKDIVFVTDEKIIYNHKYLDRAQIEQHTKNMPASTEIIFIKKNMLRDASYSNIALYNGVEWHTPTYPLLKGTMRAQLVANGKLRTKKIYYKELDNYTEICFINALNNLRERNYKLK